MSGTNAGVEANAVVRHEAYGEWLEHRCPYRETLLEVVDCTDTPIARGAPEGTTPLALVKRGAGVRFGEAIDRARRQLAGR